MTRLRWLRWLAARDRDADVLWHLASDAERELCDMARRRNEDAGRYAADAASARTDRDRLARHIRALETELAERDRTGPSRREQCQTLAECTANRAAASRVTRVVGDGDTAAAAERCITGSGCAPAPEAS